MSIAADMVPITGENRILAAHGLRRFNEDAPAAAPGLAALRELATLREGPLGISSLVFGFAPRINAAGRMGDARRAVAMLLAPDQQEARYTAEVVDQMNQQRRGSDQHTTQEALALIAASPDAAKRPRHRALQGRLAPGRAGHRGLALPRPVLPPHRHPHPARRQGHRLGPLGGRASTCTRPWRPAPPCSTSLAGTARPLASP